MSRDYVIINGKNSLTITGLAIKTLPPISKPLMRTMREEIDGRDGDINTELGYQAYDKPLEVGLFGSYDINEIIAFFNSKGTIVFSDEPDKFYNFEILDKIDFTKLVKFRTAMVNIHCQPFKYPTTETPIEVAYEYVEGTGESLTLDNTEASSLSLELKGNTSQTTYNGYNLLDVAHCTTQVMSGITSLTKGNNFLQGTTSATDWAGLYAQFQLEAGTYYYKHYTQVTGVTNSNGLGTFRVNKNTPSGGEIFNQNVTLNVANQINSATFTITEAGTYAFTYRFGNHVAEVKTMTIKDIILSKTDQAYEPYVGGIPSPNPNYPQDIEVVTGDNEIEITNKNLFKLTPTTNPISNHGLEMTTDGETISITGTNATNNLYPSFIFYADGTTAISDWYATTSNINTSKGFFTSSNLDYVMQTIKSGTFDKTQLTMIIGKETITNSNAIWSSEDTYDRSLASGTERVNFVAIGFLPSQTANVQFKIQIEKGTTKTSFVKHQSQTYPLTLGSLEMCNIGTYEDYFEYDNEKWYKKANIGKIDLSTLTWTNGGNYAYSRGLSNIKYTSTNTEVGVGLAENYTLRMGSGMSNPAWWGYMAIDTNQITINPANNTLAGAGWFYYALATETSTEITGTLKTQLDNIREALSYSGQTNITQTNDNKPFRITASALKKGSDTAVVNNTGNIYSKPTIELEGTGIVNIYKDGTQAFEVDLSEENNITIDTDKMEAYTDTGLANRKVTGDYSKFKLDSGTSNIKFDGALTSATITNYKRWL